MNTIKIDFQDMRKSTFLEISAYFDLSKLVFNKEFKN